MSDNRTNEPTEAMIEAAAKALYEFETGLAEDSWGRAFEVERSLWKDQSRAALEAADAVVTEPVDHSELIAEADKSYEDVFNVAQRERDLIRRLADALEGKD